MKSKKNDGKEFEQLTESIFNSLVRNPEYEKVEHNIQLPGHNGFRQIDILLTTITCGMEIRTVIECKDYNKKISIGKVDELESKLKDVNANRGILVSKKGFSSMGKSKAKRVGISLCTAHEALHDNWNPEIDLPILIEEVKPNGFGLLLDFKILKRKKLPVSEFPIINDINIVELMEKKWKEGTLGIQPKSGVQTIKLKEINKPYTWIPEGENIPWPVRTFEINITVEANYYLTSFGELKNTKILNNISDNKNSVFMDISSIKDVINNVKPVKENYKNDFKGILLSLDVTPNFSLKPTGVQQVNR
jgi:hypothetical protein